MKRIISYVNSNPPLNSAKREKMLSRIDLVTQEAPIYIFCVERSYDIVKSFRDTCPSASFLNRPAWKRLMKYVKANKGQVDEILVSRWDRFSSSQIEASFQISELKKLGITVNAVQQTISI